mmetsp:Transcript_49083/g.78407  ORF Transcript_49083/g.78407 Transcript_49083/m.78407 type:complete len:402 (-) Transcript_49083:77-1282(-)
MSSLSLYFLAATIAISSSWDLPNPRGRINRNQHRQIPRFSHDARPSRDSFKLPQRIRDRFHLDAGAGAGMYGLAGPSYQAGYAALVQYDIESGNTTTVQTPNGNPLTGESLGCLDNIHKVWFFIYEEVTSEEKIVAGLYPYDLADDTTAYDPILLPSLYADAFVGAGDECTADPNTGDIYVFGHDANNLQYQLLLRVVFDPQANDATVTQVGNYSMVDDIPLLAGEITMYDSKRNMLWLAGEDGNDTNNFTIDYFYIDAKTGVVQNVINFEEVPIDVALYNPTLDMVVGLKTAGRDVKGYFSFQMVYADPVTLEVNQTFDPFTNDWCAWEAIYTQDVDDGVFYGLLYKLPDNGTCTSYNGTYLGHLVGVDVNKGTVKTEPEFCKFGTVLTCPWALQYWDGK